MKNDVFNSIRKKIVVAGTGLSLLVLTGCDTPSDTNLAGGAVRGAGFVGVMDGSLSPLGGGLLDILGSTLQNEAVIESQQQNTDRIVNEMRNQRQNAPVQYESRQTRRESVNDVEVVRDGILGEYYVNRKLHITYGRGFFGYEKSSSQIYMAVFRELKDVNGDGIVHFPEEWIGVSDKWEEGDSFSVAIGASFILKNRARIKVINLQDEKEILNAVMDRPAPGYKHTFFPGFVKPGLYEAKFYDTIDESARPLGTVNFSVREKKTHE